MGGGGEVDEGRPICSEASLGADEEASQSQKWKVIEKGDDVAGQNLSPG